MDGDIVIKAVHFQEVCCQPCVDLVVGQMNVYVGLEINREENFDEIVKFNECESRVAVHFISVLI